MLVDIAILVGLVINAYIWWRIIGDIEQLEEIVGKMLYDLGKKGVLEVEVIEDDGEA